MPPPEARSTLPELSKPHPIPKTPSAPGCADFKFPQEGTDSLAGPQEHLRALKRVHRNTRAGGTQYNFVWLDATQQAALAAALDAGGEAPRLVRPPPPGALGR